MRQIYVQGLLHIGALAAEGESEITGIHHIERGYVNIAVKLSMLGADIHRKAESISEHKSKTEKSEEEFTMTRVQPTWA